jgi:hypothetical protein
MNTHQRFQEAVSSGVWHSQDGRITKIPELHGNHLRNILRLLKKKAVVDCGKRKASYLTGPVDMPEEAYAELDRLTWDGCKHPQFDELYEEARKRGILANVRLNEIEDNSDSLALLFSGVIKL